MKGIENVISPITLKLIKIAPPQDKIPGEDIETSK